MGKLHSLRILIKNLILTLIFILPAFADNPSETITVTDNTNFIFFATNLNNTSKLTLSSYKGSHNTFISSINSFSLYANVLPPYNTMESLQISMTNAQLRNPTTQETIPIAFCLYRSNETPQTCGSDNNSLLLSQSHFSILLNQLSQIQKYVNLLQSNQTYPNFKIYYFIKTVPISNSPNYETAPGNYTGNVNLTFSATS